MKEAIMCPVCGKERKQFSSLTLDCECCGFNNAFIHNFASKSTYDAWKKMVDKEKTKKYCDKVDLSFKFNNFKLSNNAVSYLDEKSQTLYIAFGNGNFQIEHNVREFVFNAQNYAILYMNGTVKVFGNNNDFGQKNTNSWINIQHIYMAPNCIFGVNNLGNVVFSGNVIDDSIRNWKNIEKMFINDGCIIGLSKDGKFNFIQNNNLNINITKINDWKNINKLLLNRNYVVGMLANEEIKYIGTPNDAHVKVKNWKDVKLIESDNAYIYGLTKQGTLLIEGKCNDFLDQGRKTATKWKKLISISTNKSGICGIDYEGNLIFAGSIEGDIAKILKTWNEKIKTHIKFN